MECFFLFFFHLFFFLPPAVQGQNSPPDMWLWQKAVFLCATAQTDFQAHHKVQIVLFYCKLFSLSYLYFDWVETFLSVCLERVGPSLDLSSYLCGKILLILVFFLFSIVLLFWHKDSQKRPFLNVYSCILKGKLLQSSANKERRRCGQIFYVFFSDV